MCRKPRIHRNREVQGDANFVCHRTEFVLSEILRQLASQKITSTMRVLGGRLGGPVPTMTFIGICSSTVEVDWTYDRYVSFRLSPCDYV